MHNEIFIGNLRLIKKQVVLYLVWVFILYSINSFSWIDEI